MGPFLKTAFIPIKHCSHWCLHMADVLLLTKTAWLFATSASMNELGPKTHGWKPKKGTGQRLDPALLMGFNMDRRDELFHSCYTLLDGLAHPMFSLEPIRRQMV